METFRPYMDDSFNESALWNWSQKKAMLTPPPIFGLHKTVTPGKVKSTKGGDTTKAGGAGTVKKAKVAAEPTTSTTKFCLVDAFEYLGISEKLDAATREGAGSPMSVQSRPGNTPTLQCRRGSRHC